MTDLRRVAAARPLLATGVAALATLVVAAAARFVPTLVRGAVRPSPCFVTHYTLTRLLTSGVDLARTYDDAWFEAQTARVTPGVTDINVNPPTTALLLLPVAGLDYTGARIAWTVFSAAVLAATVAFVLKETGLAGPWALGFVALTLLYQPLAADFAVANVYTVLLGLTVLAWHGWRTRNEPLLGVALAAMLAIKLAGGLLWVLVFAERRWRAAAWGAATAAAVAGLSLPWLGAAAWRADAAALLDAAERPERAVTAYQSVPGLFHHLFSSDPLWNPAPVAHAPLLAAAAPWLVLAALVGAGVAAARRCPLDDRVFAAFVVAGVVASPLALDYTYTLLLLPAAVALAWVRERRSPLALATLVAAVVPIAADLPYRSPRLAAGGWALLAYPKLAGALLLSAGLLAAAWYRARIPEALRPLPAGQPAG